MTVSVDNFFENMPSFKAHFDGTETIFSSSQQQSQDMEFPPTPFSPAFDGSLMGSDLFDTSCRQSLDAAFAKPQDMDFMSPRNAPPPPDLAAVTPTSSTTESSSSHSSRKVFKDQRVRSSGTEATNPNGNVRKGRSRSHSTEKKQQHQATGNTSPQKYSRHVSSSPHQNHRKSTRRLNSAGGDSNLSSSSHHRRRAGSANAAASRRNLLGTPSNLPGVYGGAAAETMRSPPSGARNRNAKNFQDGVAVKSPSTRASPQQPLNSSRHGARSRAMMSRRNLKLPTAEVFTPVPSTHKESLARSYSDNAVFAAPASGEEGSSSHHRRALLAASTKDTREKSSSRKTIHRSASEGTTQTIPPISTPMRSSRGFFQHSQKGFSPSKTTAVSPCSLSTSHRRRAVVSPSKSHNSPAPRSQSVERKAVSGGSPSVRGRSGSNTDDKRCSRNRSKSRERRVGRRGANNSPPSQPQRKTSSKPRLRSKSRERKRNVRHNTRVTSKEKEQAAHDPLSMLYATLDKVQAPEGSLRQNRSIVKTNHEEDEFFDVVDEDTDARFGESAMLTKEWTPEDLKQMVVRPTSSPQTKTRRRPPPSPSSSGFSPPHQHQHHYVMSQQAHKTKQQESKTRRSDIMRSIKDLLTSDQHKLKLELQQDGTKRLVMDLSDLDTVMGDFSVSAFQKS